MRQDIEYMLEYFYQRIAEKVKQNNSAPVLLIPFGDSVTQGCMEFGVIEHAHVYHNVLKRMLETRYPHCTFSVYNAGISGENTEQGLKRLDRDVLRHDPDLVLIGYCLNDSTSGMEKLDSYVQNMRLIIERIRTGTKADIIIVTPNFMASHETLRISEQHRHLVQTVLDSQNHGILNAYVSALRKLAIELNVPVADVYSKWEDMDRRGIDTTEFLVNGLNHPDAERQTLIASTVFDLIISNDK